MELNSDDKFLRGLVSLGCVTMQLLFHPRCCAKNPWMNWKIISTLEKQAQGSSNLSALYCLALPLPFSVKVCQDSELFSWVDEGPVLVQVVSCSVYGIPPKIFSTCTATFRTCLTVWLIGPWGKLFCFCHAKKYAVHVIQHSIHIWLVDWSGCSSPSTGAVGM